MSRIYELTKASQLIKKSSLNTRLPDPFRPDPSRLNINNPLGDVLGTAAYLLSPLSALPSFLAAPLEIGQQILIDTILNKIKAKKAERQFYSEGMRMALTNPFLVMKKRGDGDAR